MTALPWRLVRFQEGNKKSALDFSVKDAPAALPQNCQTTTWILEAAPLWCKRHFGNAEFLAETAIASVRSNFRRMGHRIRRRSTSLLTKQKSVRRGIGAVTSGWIEPELTFSTAWGGRRSYPGSATYGRSARGSRENNGTTSLLLPGLTGVGSGPSFGA